MERLSIEENLASIAESLYRLANLGEAVLLAYAEEDPCEGEPEPAAETPTPVVIETQPQQWTYETLKAELIRRGVQIAKGTKMTTLLKFWELHKNDLPVAEEAPLDDDPGEEIETEPEVVVEEPTEDEEVVEPVPVEEEVVEPVPAEETPAEEPVAEVADAKPMTVEDARSAIRATGYDGRATHLEAMRIALHNAGVARFALLQTGQFERFVADYKAELAKLEGAN